MIKFTLHIVIVLTLFTASSCNSGYEYPKNTNNSKIDSINHWIEQVKNTSLQNLKRENILEKAYEESTTLKNDSLRGKLLIEITQSSQFVNTKKLFRKYNREAFELSQKNKDTLGLARTHFFYGSDYYNNREMYDSAYFHFNKAKGFNTTLNRTEMIGWNLFEMAYILNDTNNYTGSEILITEAIDKFTQVNIDLGLITSFGLLATIYGNLEQYENSLIYEFKALELLKNLENKNSLSKDYILDTNLIHRSNLGSTYFLMGNYKKALKYYKEVFANSKIKDINLNLYYRLIHNINYTKFKLGDTLHVQENLYKTLKFRDSVRDIAGIIDSKIDLAQYHAHFKDTIKAINHTKEAKLLAASIQKNDDYLESLQLLANLDTKNAKLYLGEYISLNDSLQKEERNIRNKFTRIQFETNEQLEKVAKLSHEKILISTVGAGIIIMISLLYYIRIQRSNNHKLQFEKEQQSANEEIYQLMLQQRQVLEEGRLKERQRVSKELHDGIIGKIFGTRMNLDFLKFNGTTTDELKYKNLINELQDIEKEVRIISHELKNEELESQDNFNTIIEHLVKTQSAIGKFTYAINSIDIIDWSKMEGTIKINIYRILQEVLQNCNKHAEASKVLISFKKNKNSFLLKIKDNGKGFDVQKSKSGIGLENLKSRAQSMKGTLTITSNTHSGTQIDVKIPISSNTTKR